VLRLRERGEDCAKKEQEGGRREEVWIWLLQGPGREGATGVGVMRVASRGRGRRPRRKRKESSSSRSIQASTHPCSSRPHSSQDVVVRPFDQHRLNSEGPARHNTPPFILPGAAVLAQWRCSIALSPASRVAVRRRLAFMLTQRAR